MADRRIYASRAVRWGRSTWFVVTAPTEWVRVYMDTGPLGDHARWLMSHKRPEGMRRQLFGTVRLGGPGPLGFKLIDGPRLHWVRVGFGAELLGWLIAAWAVREALRSAERGRGRRV